MKLSNSFKTLFSALVALAAMYMGGSLAPAQTRKGIEEQPTRPVPEPATVLSLKFEWRKCATVPDTVATRSLDKPMGEPSQVKFF